MVQLQAGLANRKQKEHRRVNMKIDTNSLAHTTWNCKYHIVFAPKYRVGLSMMCYTFGKVNRTCLGERQLSGRMGKSLYCRSRTANCFLKSSNE